MAIDGNRVLVTGANGVLGRQLLRTVAGAGGRPAAVVRSESAAETLAALPGELRPTTHVVDYRDVPGLSKAMAGRELVIHLVGILKESKRSRYAAAHEEASAAVAEAAQANGIQRIVYLSILGSHPEAGNACLASKGRAEALLLEHPVPATVIRLPMVLGDGDMASRALRGEAQAKLLPLMAGGRSFEQPIDADDVVSAILAACERPELADRSLDLAGPESLPARELILRAAALYGNRPRFFPLPVPMARLFARAVERFSDDPPVTEAMLDVLLHDDRIDPAPAARALGITLTSLDTMLARRVGPDSSEGNPS
ncbi:MAG: NAD(P)H-binding protein [Deltaproteobacteria bacterium]|nr:NAD(P)H-binding protein [Deltaproteobacteria bacterium]MBW2447851.1 NAD(P)H-binding protein [Deltaproteobacteria bacterium]